MSCAGPILVVLNCSGKGSSIPLHLCPAPVTDEAGDPLRWPHQAGTGPGPSGNRALHFGFMASAVGETACAMTPVLLQGWCHAGPRHPEKQELGDRLP